MAEAAEGRVIAVRGSVVDVRLPAGALPAINEAVAIEWDLGTPLVAEVHQHLDRATVRTVALAETAGLCRGTRVRASGAPIRVPVGEPVLGRLPSRVGYQPTPASEIAELEERIASVAGTAITSIQAVYVPADDFTDPAMAEIFSHLDSSIVLARDMASDGMYPAADPLASASALLDPRLVGESHYRIAQEARRTIVHYRELQEIIALLGIEELNAADRVVVRRARRLLRFLTQPFMVTEAFTGKPGRAGEIESTLAGCRVILDGETDA